MSERRRLLIWVAVAAAMFLALFASVRARRHAALRAEREAAVAVEAEREARAAARSVAEGPPPASAESVPNRTEREQVAATPEEVLLEVRVLSADDRQPIAGAWVTCDEIELETDANGVAAIHARDAEEYRELWASGDLQIDVLAERCIPRSVTVPARAERIDVWMLLGVALSGVVVDAFDKKPIASASLAFRQSWNGDVGVLERRETNGEGEFEAVIVRPSFAVEIEIHAAGYAETELMITPELDEHRDFAIGAGGIVRGIVRDEGGQFVGGAAVDVIVSNDRDHAAARVATNADGRFEFRGLPLPGAYFVDASINRSLQSGTHSGRCQPFMLDVAHSVHLAEITLRDPAASIDVEVVDETGAPVDSAWLRIDEITIRSWRRPVVFRERFSASATTNASGRCSIAVPRVSDYSVEAAAREFVPSRCEFAVDDETRTSIRLVLARGQSLSGSAFGSNGSPLVGLEVSAWVQSELASREVPTSTTGESGAFHFRGLPAGDVWLRATPMGICGEDTPSIQQRFGPFRVGVTDIRIQVADAGRVSFQLAPVPRSREIDFNLTWNSGDSIGGRIMRTGTNGVVALCGPPGVARLVVACDGDPPFEVGVLTLPSGAHSDLGVVARPDFLSLSGIVLSVDGAPIPDAEVLVGTNDIFWTASATSGPGGTFSIGRVPALAGWMQADARGFVALEEEIANLAGGGSIQIHLSRELHVRGSIRATSRTFVGEPVVCALSIAADGSMGAGSCEYANADGTYELELEPGRYALFLYPFGSDEPIRGPEIEIGDQDVTFDWDV